MALERISEETAAKGTKTSTSASKSSSNSTKSSTTTRTNTNTTKTRRLATRVRKRTSTLLRSKSWKKRTKRARTRTRVRRGREWGDRVEVPMIRRASCACHCYCPGVDLVLRTLLIIKYDGTALGNITCNLTRQKASRCPQLRSVFLPHSTHPACAATTALYGVVRATSSAKLLSVSSCTNLETAVLSPPSCACTRRCAQPAKTAGHSSPCSASMLPSQASLNQA